MMRTGPTSISTRAWARIGIILTTPSGMFVKRVRARWIAAREYETGAENPVSPRTVGARAKITTVE
jgi:hypothetical protein